MMRVYAVKADVNSYQYLLPEDAKASFGALTFDGKPKAATWIAPALYIHQPKLRRGNFLGAGTGKLACDQHTREDARMSKLMEMSGELLPFQYEGEQFYILNVVQCVNALDRERTHWPPEMRQKIGIPSKHVFFADRIPNAPLFKIPETSRSTILCAGNTSSDRTFDFKYNYERLGLTGLRFESLWNNE